MIQNDSLELLSECGFAMVASRYTLGARCPGCNIKVDLVHLKILYFTIIFHASRSCVKVVCLKHASDCVFFCTWLHHNVWLGCDIDRRNGRPTIGRPPPLRGWAVADVRPPTNSTRVFSHHHQVFLDHFSSFQLQYDWGENVQ